MKSKTIIIIVFLALISASFFTWKEQVFSKAADIFSKGESVSEEEFKPQDKVVSLEVTDGSTYSQLMEEAGVGGSVSSQIYQAAEAVYDLAKVRVGRTLDFVYDKDTGEFKELVYQIGTEDELYVTKTAISPPRQASGETGDQLAVVGSEETQEETTQNEENIENNTIEPEYEWLAERRPIEYEVRIKTGQGMIESSLYLAALEQDIDERAIIGLANVFQWTIDFGIDVRTGDKFSFVYEERYLDGEYIMPGEILAARYDSAFGTFYAYYFEADEETHGHFDEQGNSVQKIFLKAPVEFKYISSGFTTGKRYVAAFKQYNSSHRAIDYAANSGTPVRAVGDGTVISAGWNGPYGNFISVRHNQTYTTNYAHLSGYAIKKGQSVEQGQTIGYVGSTGYSTGPHLHYEMVKNGTKVNPLREELPPGEPIDSEHEMRFFDIIVKYKPMLDE